MFMFMFMFMFKNTLARRWDATATASFFDLT
jgi:hypothetical protein